MKRSLFNYTCPPELIAQEPVKDRDKSRLLVFDKNQTITDHIFSDLPNILDNVFLLKQKNKKLLLIANDSKVYPARLRVYRKTGGQCELFILENDERENYSCLIKSKSKLKENEIFYLDENQNHQIFKIVNLNSLKVKPLFSQSMSAFLEEYGETPLPPYIKRKKKDFIYLKGKDKDRYQNVYANENNLGSSAAPTAGFHFTKNLMSSFPEFNMEIDYITLHVGLGTFLPVKTDNISEHFMHEEYYCIKSSVLKKILDYLQNDWPIVLIGTTSLRAVESFFRKCLLKNTKVNFKDNNFRHALFTLSDQWYATNLFLYPKNEHDFHAPLVGNGLLTNFHQPESSLLMLVSSLIGFKNLKSIYNHALDRQYRFFSYGDASLLFF